MCRITGFWDFNYKGGYDILKTITDMRDSLIHGGPDDGGVYVHKEIGLALGHRRLAILDLSPLGRQPMEFDNLVIVYNGEVYNFFEIKKELESCGYKFISNTDTEVVLKAFHKWGIDAVHKFRGMFAFAIWNKNTKELILIRDRVGVKPLYWHYKNGLFIFASELKALHKHPYFSKELDKTGLSLYLQYGYISSPYSIFKYTYKLEPGHYLKITSSGDIEKSYYWKIESLFMNGLKEEYNNEDKIAEELENILVDSFKLRLISDVPVGVFLSGGIDSSTVCTLLSKEGVKLKTFTIGFHEKEYNEAEYAKKIADYLGTDHTELYCSTEEALDIIPKLPELYDEPFGDPSAIPTYLVSCLAKEKVKVVLSADGGDEQFCGYSRYWIMEYINKRKTLLKGVIKLLNPKLISIVYRFIVPFLFPSANLSYNNFSEKHIKLKEILKYDDITSQYDKMLRVFFDQEIKKLGINMHDNRSFDLNSYEENSIDHLSLFMLFDLKTYLPDDILVKIDRASMGTALEAREPLLDNKILEFTSRLPSVFKFKNGVSKYILRKILYKYVPKELIDRPKQGFSVPINEWFRKDLSNLYKEYLSEERIGKIGIFNYQIVKGLLEAYLSNGEVHHNKLWLLFIFELWREKWKII